MSTRVQDVFEICRRMQAAGISLWEQAVQAQLIQLLQASLSPGETAPGNLRILPSHNAPMELATSVAASVHAALPAITRGESP